MFTREMLSLPCRCLLRPKLLQSVPRPWCPRSRVSRIFSFKSSILGCKNTGLNECAKAYFVYLDMLSSLNLSKLTKHPQGPSKLVFSLDMQPHFVLPQGVYGECKSQVYCLSQHYWAALGLLLSSLPLPDFSKEVVFL